MGGDFEKPLRIAGNKHDLVAVRIYDQRETELPDIGLVRMADAESGELFWVDSHKRAVREHYRKWYESTVSRVQELLVRCGVDSVSLRTDQDFVPPLIRLFKMRSRS